MHAAAPIGMKSTAGLSAKIGSTGVSPRPACSGCSPGSVFCLSLDVASPHDCAESMLPPPPLSVPVQLSGVPSPVFPEMIEAVTLNDSASATAIPAPAPLLLRVFDAIVVRVSVVLLRTSPPATMPPPGPLPVTVESLTARLIPLAALASPASRSAPPGPTPPTGFTVVFPSMRLCVIWADTPPIRPIPPPPNEVPAVTRT